MITFEESRPNWKRPLSKVSSPSSLPCLTSVVCLVIQMRRTCEPSWPPGKSGFTTPPVPASAAASVGYQVREAMGRLSLKVNSCAQLPPQVGPLQLRGAPVALVPAKLKKVALAPVIGSFGRLRLLESCPSNVSENRSFIFQTVFRPTEPSLNSCMLRCCS